MEVDLTATSDRLWEQYLAAVDGPDDDFDDDLVGRLLRELNRRAEPELVQWALPLLTDSVGDRRWAAAWALQDHGTEAGHRFTAEVLPALVAAAADEADDDVRAAIVGAIGHADDPAWVPSLVAHASDPSAGVRRGVAANLPIMFAGGDMSPPAVDALIGLSADPDPEVRDWATMSLGTQSDLDTPAIRSALHARLDDYEGVEQGRATSGEALVGLARRHDGSIRDRLATLLAAPVHEVGNLTVEAAGELGDPCLLPALRSLRDRGWAADPDEPLPSTLDDAISALGDSPPRD